MKATEIGAKSLICLVLLNYATARAHDATVTLKQLYQFPGLSDGEIPWGILTSAGGTLYGTTLLGGAYGRGTIFSINPNSGVEKVVYSFQTGPDAANPQAGLYASGKLLYGVSNTGGTYGYGAVYTFDPATSQEKVLFSLTPAIGGGSGSNVVFAGDMLYGTSYGGGSAAGYGVIFKVNTKTGAGSIVYSFTGGADGGSPQTGLAYVKGTLYGGTTLGGSGGGGTLFAVDAKTGAETTLYSFDYGAAGGSPQGGVIAVKNILYGAAGYGGANGAGVIFAYDLATKSESTVYTFTGGSDGSSPLGTLSYQSGTLFGASYRGGSYGYGTVFGLNLKTGTETAYYSFSGGADGGHPVTPVLDLKGVLYATATSESLASGTVDGAVVSVNLGSGSATALHTFLGGANEPGNAAPIEFQSTIYGTAGATGSSLYGSVYKLDPSTGVETTVYSFTGGADGGGPIGQLAVSGETLYGVTTNGGANQAGTLFALDPATATLTTAYNFASGIGRAGAAMAVLKGTLFGTTSGGGADQAGTIFKFNPAKKSYATLYSFTGGGDGGSPYAGLSTDGTTLYGSTYTGGADYAGTLYAANPSSGTQTVLHSFTGQSDGGYPLTVPVAFSGMLYGTADYGGTLSGLCFGGFGCGVLYSVSPSGTDFSVLHSFGFNGDGAVPGTPLLVNGSVIFGGTAVGGTGASAGTLFSYSPGQTGFTTLYTFSGGNDGANPAGLAGSGSSLYGVAGGGGTYGLGNLFSLTGY
jgi:uncharacterized repeat protein (TIGR03803 family)